MNLRRTLAVFGCLAAVLASAAARADGYKLDGTHSSLMFRVKHLGVNHFYGRFNHVEGELELDDKRPQDARVAITVKADSIDTNSDGRDGHLKGKASLGATDFPSITFKSTSVKAAGDTFTIRGDLTFRGVTKPVDVRALRLGSTTDAKGAGKTGFEITFSIKRSEFGMTGMGMVADQVDLIGGLEWNRVPRPAGEADKE